MNEHCSHCEVDVSKGSGNFVNRVQNFNSDPKGDFVCQSCDEKHSESFSEGDLLFQLNKNNLLFSETYQTLKTFYRDSLVELPEVAELLAKITTLRKENELFIS